MTDAEFISAFENGSLPNGSFHHRDHVRMAFLYLRRYSPLEAIQHFSASLARFAAANGKPQLYNETITCFYMLLIRERMDRLPPGHGWAEFRAAHPDLFGYPKALLERYYPGEAAFSAEAKTRFLLPHSAAPAA